MHAPTPFAELNIDGKRCHVVGYQRWHAKRDKLEQFVAQRFEVDYGAKLIHFMPLLVVLQGPEQQVLAIAGVRSALMEPLFLEQYLDNSIERVLRLQAGQRVQRHQIVEMGNLAAVQSGYSRYLFAVMTDLLLAWDFQWLCCTGVTSVRNLFRRLNMEPVVVAPALAERIPGAGDQWGSYYQKNPLVLTGEIRRGRACISRNGFLENCGYVKVEMTDVQSA